METVSKFWAWVVERLDALQTPIAPHLEWMPDEVRRWVLPGLAIGAALLVVWATAKQIVEMFRALVRCVTATWRTLTGREKAKRPEEITADDASAARRESEKTNEKLDRLEALLLGQTGDEADDEKPTRQAIERALEALQEIRASNDPSKAEARAAIDNEDLLAAEAALERAFERESHEAAVVTDEAQQLRHKAARTAREKAALAATRSVAEGAEWYAKASDLDPGHFWTWIELSRLRQSAGMIAPALEAAEKAMTAASDDRERHVSFDGKGDCHKALGDLSAALDAYEEARKLIEPLTARDPSNTGWQRDLSVAHNKIGDVLRDQGNLTEALDAYQKGRDIATNLTARDPSNTGWQRDLSVSYDRIGDVLRDQGNLTEALDAFRTSRDIRIDLAARDPSNTGWQRDLSVSYEKVGDVLRDRGNLTDALDAFRTSRDIRIDLAARDPSNTEWKRDLSVAHDRIGDVLRDLGKLTEALDAFRTSRDICVELAARDPSNAGWQRDLSVSHEKIGDVEEARGDIAAALAAYGLSLPIAEDLADRFPDHPGFQNDLMITRARLAALRAGSGAP